VLTNFTSALESESLVRLDQVVNAIAPSLVPAASLEAVAVIPEGFVVSFVDEPSYLKLAAV